MHAGRLQDPDAGANRAAAPAEIVVDGLFDG
jgi:hypothetical protein